MAQIARRQDMPPSGGYKAIQFMRIPARSYFNGFTWIGGYLAMTAGAAYVFYLTDLRVQHEEIEQRSAQFALLPMLKAERDRLYLKQLRKNRDEEADLMRNVEGWKVGTWYGERIYPDQPADTLLEPRMSEYYIHAAPKAFRKISEFTFWT